MVRACETLIFAMANTDPESARIAKVRPTHMATGRSDYPTSDNLWVSPTYSVRLLMCGPTSIGEKIAAAQALAACARESR